MHIAFVTAYDAKDVGQWSGSATFMGRALEGQAARVDYVGPLDERRPWWVRGKGSITHRVFRRAYWPWVEPAVMERVGAAARARLDDGVDVVVGLAAQHLARLRCRPPMVMWTDCPLVGLIDQYDYATNLSRGSRRNLLAAEREAIDRCAAVVYASEWAADLARRTHGVPADKLHVIPFGANLDDPPTAAAALAAAAARPTDVCRLLFLGVDWKRKGGDLAVEATRQLNAAGIPARLLVAGCAVPPAHAGLPFVEPVGFISKRTEDGRRRLAELFATSHLLLLPTRAEAYGVVFAEASASAVPSVTTDVGGVGGVVTNGVNGVRLPLDAPAAAYAAWIADLFRDPARYQALCRSARAAFDDRLNWAAAGAAFARVLRGVV